METMQLDYVLSDPTGNITVLVETPVPVELQPDCGAALLAAEPTAEQVGFLSPGGDCDIAMRMAGGEFCGNATMSTAALLCEKTGRTGRILVRASGAPSPVAVEIGRSPDGRGYTGAVEMPRPAAAETVALEAEGRQFRLPLLRFDGISHLILREPVERDFAERAIRRWCAELGADGLGLMQLDEAARRLTPLVYIPGGDTLYWEHSCASGTAATGAFLAETAGEPVEISFAEPGGTLGVSAFPGGAVTLRGAVEILHRGHLEVNFG